MASERPVVLITGAGRGIGAAVARLAAARGYDVAVNYRSDRGSAEEVVAGCREAGANAAAYQGDIAFEADVERVFADAAGLGRLVHVVNNAGITGRSARLDAAPAETIRACIDLNVTGALLVAREAARRLSRRHGGSGGSIVNISSVAAALGSPGEYVWYAASKGAVDAMTVGLAKELAEEGVRVNAVSPGLIDTEIHALSTGDPARLERLTPMIPFGRPGSADEVASAVLFLMSDEASYITGANLRVSGGR
ncbi:SDR family oxidoreductase [Salinarimonas soli]|uniref:SDR family oxidoreductase n=1 Tax=Salinarimonas soli TaxID=1638099 RepID=A0A5B2W028_9HYPH|nr:SDR family oxidoreductase [Salinarimonas soli]KAA2244040.1 SDR family oxidoreductase [Salinarimonas soli]